MALRRRGDCRVVVVSLLNWPPGWDRTPDAQRESTSKFSTGFRKSERDLRKELERMDVDEWRLDHVTGSGGDPGVVLRWTMDGEQFAVACDAWTAKRDNLRSVYLWVNETRMRGQRPVKTGDTEFAAARLPAGDDPVVGEEPPHVVLDIDPDADGEEVRSAFRAKVKEAHPDNGGDEEQFKRVQKAREELL